MDNDKRPILSIYLPYQQIYHKVYFYFDNLIFWSVIFLSRIYSNNRPRIKLLCSRVNNVKEDNHKPYIHRLTHFIYCQLLSLHKGQKTLLYKVFYWNIETVQNGQLLMFLVIKVFYIPLGIYLQSKVVGNGNQHHRHLSLHLCTHPCTLKNKRIKLVRWLKISTKLLPDQKKLSKVMYCRVTTFFFHGHKEQSEYELQKI